MKVIQINPYNASVPPCLKPLLFTDTLSVFSSQKHEFVEIKLIPNGTTILLDTKTSTGREILNIANARLSYDIGTDLILKNIFHALATYDKVREFLQ